MEIALILILLAIFAALGYAVCEDKPTGALLGFLLGPIGLIIAALIKK